MLYQQEPLPLNLLLILIGRNTTDRLQDNSLCPKQTKGNDLLLFPFVLFSQWRNSGRKTDCGGPQHRMPCTSMVSLPSGRASTLQPPPLSNVNRTGQTCHKLRSYCLCLDNQRHFLACVTKGQSYTSSTGKTP